MSRLLPLCLVLLLFACPSGEDRRRTLEGFVPDDATGMLSVDVQAWRRLSERQREIATELVGSDDIMAIAARMEAKCGYDPASLVAMVGAMRLRPGDDPHDPGMVLALRGPRLGTKETIECLAQVLARTWELPAEAFEIGEDEGRTVLRIAGGQFVIWGVDGATLVVATDEWADEVRERIHGRGVAALGGAFRGTLGSTPIDAPIWFAMALSDLPSVSHPVAGARRAAGSLRVGRDLELSATLHFEDEASATAAAPALYQYMEVQQLVVPKVPKAVFDSFVFEQESDRILVSATVPGEAS